MDGKIDGVVPPPLPAQSPPNVQSFACPQCGAPLTIRGLKQTESIACGSCNAIIDITDENFRILETFNSRIKYSPLVPLGSRGKLKGELFELIGYLRRSIEVDGIEYEWSEYLLFNPYKGFRWLSEYNGHWNLIKTTTNMPKPLGSSDTDSVSYLGETFRHFQSAYARVTYIVGEFYWKAQVGEGCAVTDYVSPPLILSKEVTDLEIIWSVGEYIEPQIVSSAFQLTEPLPTRIGVAPNQPSPYQAHSRLMWQTWAIFLFLLLFLEVMFLLLSGNKLVYQNEFAFHQADAEKARVTESFDLPGRTSNVVIKTHANVSNSWLYLNMALINEETGHAYDFGREISYYFGVDGGESWSEGSANDEVVLPEVPPGRYYLRLEPESAARDMNYALLVYRDVPRGSYFLAALGALMAIPLVHLWRSRSYEYYRWSESDHPMRPLISTSNEED